VRRRLFVVAGIVVVWLFAGATAAGAGISDDGIDGVGVVDVSSGVWYLRDAGTGDTTSFYFGNPGDVPLMGDWDGDGVDTPGMYRQSDGFVYLSNSNTEGVADIRFFFGDPSDVPLAGDFDGDGFDTVSIYRPSNQTFYVINELGADGGGLGAADFSYVFGNPGDAPFSGDFDGDGIDTFGLHRESTGLVYFRNSHTGGIADSQFIYGDPGDKIIAGKWTTEHTTDTVGLYRRSLGEFFLRHDNSSGNADARIPYGNERMAFGALPGGDVSPPSSLTVITDSVVLGAQRYFPDAFPGWEIDLLGHPALMLHQLEDTVLPPGVGVYRNTLIAIGYNSLWQKDRENFDKWAAKFDREANAVLDLVRARGAINIVWVTLREASPEAIITPQQIDQNNRFGFYMYYVNERLRLLADANPDVSLADWAAASTGPGNTYDLIHLNPTGARLMIDTITASFGL